MAPPTPAEWEMRPWNKLCGDAPRSKAGRNVNPLWQAFKPVSLGTLQSKERQIEMAARWGAEVTPPPDMAGVGEGPYLGPKCIESQFIEGVRVRLGNGS